MKSRCGLIAFVAVFLPALLLRLYPVTSESFQFDAIVSQLAANEGFGANAWDEHGTFALRRHHPPLLSYLILANEALIGEGPFRSRIFSIVLGAAACLVVGVAVMQVLRGVPGRLWAGLYAGWLLCLLPVHLYVSRTANWDATYTFFSMVALAFLSVYLLHPRFRWLALAGVAGSLAFLVCEIGLTLLPSFALVLAADLRRRGTSALRQWLGAIGIGTGIVAVLWPAGLFHLNVARTIRFRLIDSVGEERNLPWTEFYVTLFQQAPAFTIIAALGLAAFVALVIRWRRRVHESVGLETRALAGLAPFATYVLTAFLLSLGQRLVFVHHIVDLLPPLVVVAVASLALWISRRRRPVRRLASMLAVAALVLASLPAFDTDAEVVGPEEHPGMIGVSEYLRSRPEVRVYYHHATSMRYYGGPRVESGFGRPWTEESLRAVKREGFDLVVTDPSLFGDRVSDLDAFVRAMTPEYAMAHVVYHRRTHEPVAWIVARRDSSTPP